MKRKFVRYKKRPVYASVLTFILKKRIADEDESVPFMFKKDLYRDKVVGAATH